MKSDLGKIWGEAAALVPKTARRALPWMVLTIGFREVSNIGVEELVKFNDRFMLSGLLFSLAIALIVSVVGIIVSNQIAFDAESGELKSLPITLKVNFKYVFIESSRALWPITLKTLMFIVPGLVEGIRLYFIPYIVQFEPQYAEGKIDALERSRQLVKGRFWAVAGILILSVLLSILPQLWLGQWRPIAAPVPYLIGFAAAITIELYSYLVLYCAYRRLTQV